jgi:hypothetical protein
VTARIDQKSPSNAGAHSHKASRSSKMKQKRVPHSEGILTHELPDYAEAGSSKKLPGFMGQQCV